MAVIGGRLFLVQIIEHSKWMELAHKQHLLENRLPAERGQILMMDGDRPVPVVMNQTVWRVIVDPMVVKTDQTKDFLKANLAKFLLVNWEQGIENKKLRYWVVAKDVPKSVIDRLYQEKRPGIWFQKETKRAYPEGELASKMLGFVNSDGVGQYGVEGAFNNQLKGKDGLLKTVKDVNNVPLTIGEDNIRIPAENGKPVVLTIDKNIQFQTEKTLAETMKKQGAANASALVMDPRDGRILAMANLPNYDPANYGMVKNAESYLNPVLEIPYEVASVCKAFTYAAGVNLGKFNQETIYHNTGSLMVDGRLIRNVYQESSVIGNISMQKALAYSLNTGSVEALKFLGGGEINQTGREILYEYFHDRFGLAEKTGIELNEVAGLMVGPNEGQARNNRYAIMTFGQGMDLTMIQVAAAFSALVNGGKYYTPTVVAGDLENGILKRKVLEPKREVISEQSSKLMREFLKGTRNLKRLYGVDRPGFLVGGKTGTSQVVVKGKGYVFDETVGSYVGFGGAEGELPEYLIMVKIWEEGKKFEGGRDAAPVFDSLSNYLQEYLKIRTK